MGLDIKFRLGDVTDMCDVETKVFVEDFRDEGAEEQNLCYVIRMPNMNGWVDFHPFLHNGEFYATVRANRWGDNYGPITEYLRTRGIDWEEF